MGREELGDGTIDAASVVRADEAVTGIVEGQVRHLLLAPLQSGDVLLALADWDTRIARAMRNQHRGGDPIDTMDRRDALK